ncbi:hypothetical protein FRC03_004447 [Tulasnella sp. 419]|nr:hypothetical protein FRC02_008596 [Tulasnella sp. 418]KAG8969132.1 hypothetical protein FRC03_004447 [Tulasnella sp. 419]
MTSSLDLFLNDSAVHQSAKKQAADSSSLDWLFSPTALDVLAPHPDAFDSELDSIALGSLDSDLATLPAIAIDPFYHQDINFYQYRGQADQATSQYSGYGGAPSTITSSESLSAYGSVYDSQYEPAPSVVSNNSNNTNSLSSLFPDLDFSSFELSPTSPSIEDMMLNAVDNRNNTGSRSSTSPSFDATSPSSGSVSPTFYPITSSAAKTISPSYLGTAAGAASLKSTSSLSQMVSPSIGSSVKNVPVNANSALVTGKLGRDGPASDSDPRKKYACPSCPRSFARAFNLKTHMATHDPHRVKNFHCRHSGCGRSFSRKHDLGRHMVSIHQDTTPPSAGPGPSGSSPIGVGSAERIWCDNCGRGWLAGSRDACDCDQNEHSVH